MNMPAIRLNQFLGISALPNPQPKRKVALRPIFLFKNFIMDDVTNPAMNITSGIVATYSPGNLRLT